MWLLITLLLNDMMRFKRPEITPPDWFRYRHSETGYVSRRMEYDNWIDDINAHRKANNLTPITPAQASHQCCQTIDPEWCIREKEDNQSYVVTRFGWNDFVGGMQAFGKLMLGGFKFVSQEEANRRARICSTCFFNTTPEGCGSCKRLAELITGDVAKKETPYDASLQACAVCHCANKSKVWFRLEDIPPTDDQQAKFPSFCWQKQGGENYVGTVQS